MAITMTTSKDKSLSLLRAVVYGDSGVGKTTSLATLPQDRTAIVAVERGLIPLRKMDFPVIQIEDWNDVRELVAMFKQPVEMDGKKISVLAIDSLSELSAMCKRHIVEVDRKAISKERSKGKSDHVAGVYDDLMTMEDWGLYGTRMTNFISAACHLPVHVVFTSLAAWKEDKKTGVQYRTVDLNGALAQAAPAFFDLVLHMTVNQANGESERVWVTQHTGAAYAKDCSGMLPEMVEPDWTVVMKTILNGKMKEVAA